MELKQFCPRQIRREFDGFNRTFMELKLHELIIILHTESVLIAPLWN